MKTLSLKLLRQSWRSWLGGDPHPVGPKWLALVWILLFSGACALFFTVLGFASFGSGEGAWRNLPGWWHWYKVNLVVALFIGFSIGGLFLLGNRFLGSQRIRSLTGLRRLVYFNGVPILGVAIGWPLGAAVAGYEAISWRLLEDPNALAASVLVALALSLVFYIIFASAARRLQAEKRAAEAQLRLLQGQIEPHFLFNTLANVVSLIDHDAPRAKQMLESFTDYLRSSFASLRHDQATLGSELDLVQHYLALLKTRMEERLTFSITSDPAFREACLPALLLQPLVENAIHHGLEPKVEGGHIRISAKRDGDSLVVEVADDGMGLGTSTRRNGAGVALANLRERLQTQWGATASLTLLATHPGTLATLRVPFQTAGAI